MRKINKKVLDVKGNDARFVIINSFCLGDIYGFFDSYTEAERELLDLVNTSALGVLYEIAEVVE